MAIVSSAIHDPFKNHYKRYTVSYTMRSSSNSYIIGYICISQLIIVILFFQYYHLVNMHPLHVSIHSHCYLSSYIVIMKKKGTVSCNNLTAIPVCNKITVTHNKLGVIVILLTLTKLFLGTSMRCRQRRYNMIS